MDSAEEFLARHGDPRDPPLLPDGRVVGGWSIAAFLGRGGNGEVYRVVSTSGRDGSPSRPPQAAALKILACDTDTARARFLREASLLAQMNTPAFPRFIAQGEINGRLYLVMELLEPRALPSSDAEVADFLLKLCAGVADLHRMGYVHRDIKPGNILWRRSRGDAPCQTKEGTRSCASAVPVLIDLGLVKDVTRNACASGTSLTLVNGHVAGVGTPGYAAPEQLVGDEISPAADIHALGMLANACFDGHPPTVWGRIVDCATGSIPARRYPDVAAFARAVRHRHWRRNVVLSSAGALLLAAIAIVTCGRAVAPRPTPGRDGSPSRPTPPPRASDTVHERDAWAALCSDVVTDRVERIVLNANTFTNDMGRGRYLVRPLDYNWRRAARKVPATVVRLGGATNSFSRPMQLDPGREYWIVGPGTLEGEFSGPPNEQFAADRRQKRERATRPQVERDAATGREYNVFGLAAGEKMDHFPTCGVVRLVNCTLRNRTRVRWPRNGLYYLVGPGARLELPNLTEDPAMPRAEFSDSVSDFNPYPQVTK